MDKAKIIERAKKLFAMANDAASPNEAAIAAKRLRSLIDQHGITEADLRQEKNDLGIDAWGDGRKRQPYMAGMIALGVAKYCDCIVTTTNSGGGYQFKGFEVDAISATLMFDYLMSTRERHAREFRKTSGESARIVNDFRLGWSKEMYERLKTLAAERERDFRGSGGTALVPVKMAMVEEKYGRQGVKRGARRRYADGSAVDAGGRKAKGVSLAQQMSGGKISKKLAKSC